MPDPGQKGKGGIQDHLDCARPANIATSILSREAGFSIHARINRLKNPQSLSPPDGAIRPMPAEGSLRRR